VSIPQIILVAAGTINLIFALGSLIYMVIGVKTKDPVRIERGGKLTIISLFALLIMGPLVIACTPFG